MAYEMRISDWSSDVCSSDLLSQIDTTDGIFHDPAANRALFESIKKNANQTINVVEVEAHINDDVFAELAVKELMRLITQRNRSEERSVGKECVSTCRSRC